VVVLGLALVGIGTRWLLLKNERDHLREVEREKRVQRDELQPYIQKVQELEAKRDQLRHKINVINSLKQNQRDRCGSWTRSRARCPTWCG